MQSILPRNDLYSTQIQELEEDQTINLLKKIVFESEISRIDRDKQKIELISTHPYKKLLYQWQAFSLESLGHFYLS